MGIRGTTCAEIAVTLNIPQKDVGKALSLLKDQINNHSNKRGNETVITRKL